MYLMECLYAGLVFFVPGIAEKLRMNGRAEITTDQEHLNFLAIKGRLPISVFKVTSGRGIPALRPPLIV